MDLSSNSNGGLEQGRANNNNKEVVEVANKSSLRGSDLMLRFLAFATTLVAAIVLGTDKQTKLVSMQVVPTLPPLSIPVTAKWHYLSAFVYFVVANAIACAYAALSLLLVLASRGKKKGLTMLIITMDLLMVALLFSSGGAALAVGLIGYQGNSHVQWNKVCNVFGKFCHQVAGAIVVSLLGSAVFLLLVLLATLNLHKKHH
ncbi:OLC1v1020332C1 [Oldenlandia corymbosa var. corymbosa]|uniref:CASP-like protein n=1 Tax=Oldenlandia corymbosa var. corymbosa TaxID=529605 RepID=A0AAV1EGA0_OLDCO|nr:OLC1v1020332C1 [Oldenlandia corymbosa var. corymbosa]